MSQKRITEKQSDDTIEIRRLAAAAEGADWDDEEPTKPGLNPELEPLPPRQTMTSAPDSVPAPAKGLVAVLNAMPPWAKFPTLLAILAFVGYLLAHGIKAPW